MNIPRIKPSIKSVFSCIVYIIYDLFWYMNSFQLKFAGCGHIIMQCRKFLSEISV